MQEFYNWYRRLSEHFFGPQFKGQQVRLIISRDLLDSTMSELGGYAGFLEAVKQGCHWDLFKQDPLAKKGKRLYDDWRRNYLPDKMFIKPNKQECPPYLPYLCLLCLAWTIEDEKLHPHDFYGRLESLYPNHQLGQQGNTHLKHWDRLWTGLETWANNTMSGEFGEFHAPVLGHMEYVGRPRAQVLLTATHIAKLPLLFNYLGVNNNSRFNDFENRMHQNKNDLAKYIGKSLANEYINNKQQIITIANQLIHGYLQDWDGIVPLFEDIEHQESHFIAYVVAKYLQDEFHFSYGIKEDCTEKEILVPQLWGYNNLSFKSIRDVMGHGVIFNGKNEFSIIENMAINLYNKVEIETNINITDNTKFISKSKSIRFFQWVSNQYLFEIDGLPTIGIVYILVYYNEQTTGNWKKWRCAAENEGVKIYEFKTNLGERFGFFCAQNLNVLDQFFKDKTPLFDDDNSSGNERIMRLIGGTTLHAGVIRKTYLRYDLPIIEIIAPHDYKIECSKGLELEELYKKTLPNTNNNLELSRFYLECEENIYSAEINIRDVNNNIIESKKFNISKDTFTVSKGGFRLDSHGQGTNSNNVGFFGAKYFGFLNNKSYYYPNINNFLQENNCSVQAFLNSKSVKLLATLDRIVNYSEFKRRAIQVADYKGNYLSQEIRMLCNLSYIDIQRGDRGHWQRIIPAPLTFYPLPYKIEGKKQPVIITGSTNIESWNKIFEYLQKLEVNFSIDFQHQCWELIPPRVSLLLDYYNDFQTLYNLLKEEVGDHLELQLHPPSLLLADYSVGLDDWLKNITAWLEHDENNPPALKTYQAQSFTNVEGNANSLGNYKLLLLEDRHIKNWQWHKLINIKEHLYSNVRDYSWARWICHVDAIRALAEHVGINDIPINIPYDSKTGTLILPNQLTLPYLLARAIALSSGFAPDYLKNHPAWQAGRVNENVFFTPGNPYNGSCWEWKGIPVTIADNVLAKVTANPVEWAKI